MRNIAVRIGVAGIALCAAVLLLLGIVVVGRGAWPAGAGIAGGRSADGASGVRPGSGTAAGRVAPSAPGGPRAPEETLEEIPADRWLGALEGGLSGAALRGDVVLVEFWTYLCYNCKNVEPWMKETHARYSGRGLEVIGVHTPEFEVEKKVENVMRYVRDNGIGWPVAIDNGYRVWRKYNKTNAWPAFLVFDREGRLVYRRAGENPVGGAGAAIEKALAEQPPRESAKRGGSGVVVMTKVYRESPRAAALEVSFDPQPGYLLVKSPPNEVRLQLDDGVTTPANPVLLGEPFSEGDSGDVVYYDGPASLRIPLELAPSEAGRALAVRGSVVYHVCDRTTNVCSRREQPFVKRIEAS